MSKVRSSEKITKNSKDQNTPIIAVTNQPIAAKYHLVLKVTKNQLTSLPDQDQKSAVEKWHHKLPGWTATIVFTEAKMIFLWNEKCESLILVWTNQMHKLLVN